MDIALIGIGKIARDQHIPAIHASADWTLAATVSRGKSVAGVDHYTDFGRFLAERPEIRIVSLCMPPVPRFAYASAAIRAGRHVMLEKPPGSTLAECYALARLAAANRVTLFASWHSREAAMVGTAKSWLAGKTIRRMEIVWKEDVRRWHPGQDWIWEPGGLGVFDPGINALSIVTHLLPEAMHLTHSQLMFPENRQTPIAANLRFAGPNDADIHARFDWRQSGPQTWSIEVVTDDGLLLLEDGGARMSLNGTPVEQTSEHALGGEYPGLYERFAELVKTGASDADFEPLRHVADAFLLGQRQTVSAFVEQEDFTDA